MSELTIDRILDHCHRLGLLHLKSQLAATLSRAEAEAWGDCVQSEWLTCAHPIWSTFMDL